MLKPLTVWITTNWKILKEMGISDHLTCLLRNLYAGREATVRTRHGKTDWFKIGKGVHQSCILSPCLFNLHTEYIMWNAGLDETQAGIKIARRNTRNSDDTTLMDSWTAARQATLSFTISQSLLKLMSIESVMPSNHLILCRPLFLLWILEPNYDMTSL